MITALHVDEILTVGNYSRAVWTTGPLLHLSGQVGSDRQGAVPADDEQQAANIVTNITTVLAAAGLSHDDVVMTRIYATTPAAAQAWRKARDAAFTAPFPASTLVFVAGLAQDHWTIEVEVTADATHRSPTADA
jgi:enamine deaminase RidA (YjgF/YER057c/UK114 family)